MVKKLSLFLLVFPVLGINPSVAQVKEAIALLNTINAKYRDNDDYTINLTYLMQRTDTGVQIDRQEGILKKKGNRMLFKLGDYETGADEKFNITIDNFNRIVFLSDPVMLKPVNLGDISQDIMSKIFSSAEISENEKDKKRIVFTIGQGDLSQVEILFNPNNFKLIQVISTYRKKYEVGNQSYPVKITVFYNKDKDKAGLKESDFAPAKYLTMNNNSFQLKPAYSTYRLINQIQKNRNL